MCNSHDRWYKKHSISHNTTYVMTSSSKVLGYTITSLLLTTNSTTIRYTEGPYIKRLSASLTLICKVHSLNILKGNISRLSNISYGVPRQPNNLLYLYGGHLWYSLPLLQKEVTQRNYSGNSPIKIKFLQ